MSRLTPKSWWNKSANETSLPRADEVQAERARRFEEGTDVAPPLAPEPLYSSLPTSYTYTPNFTYNSNIDWAIDYSTGSTSLPSTASTAEQIEHAVQDASIYSTGYFTPRYADIVRSNTASTEWYNSFIVPIIIPKRRKITVNTRRKWD